MREDLRRTGIEPVGEVPWGTHLCQFFQTREDILDVLIPYFRAGLESNEACMWVTSSPLSPDDVRLRRSDGAVSWGIASTSAIADGDGSSSGALLMITDISARKRAEDEREQLLAREQAARAEAEALVQLRERFMAVLGHDLRQPLGVICTTAEMLSRRAPDGAPEQKGLDRIVRGAWQMDGMIRDLLDFARSRSGGIPVAPRPSDLRTLCQQVADGFQTTHAGRAIRLEVEGDCSGSWDPDRLLQVLSNLTGNALHHGAADQEVVLRAEGGEDHVVLEVQSSGDPIPPDEIDAIFEPFRRARGARSPDGLGLGLFIVREIVRAHGGHVSVRSSADRGTTFTVRLPRRIALEG